MLIITNIKGLHLPGMDTFKIVIMNIFRKNKARKELKNYLVELSGSYKNLEKRLEDIIENNTSERPVLKNNLLYNKE